MSRRSPRLLFSGAILVLVCVSSIYASGGGRQVSSHGSAAGHLGSAGGHLGSAAGHLGSAAGRLSSAAGRPSHQGGKDRLCRVNPNNPNTCGHQALVCIPAIGFSATYRVGKCRPACNENIKGQFCPRPGQGGAQSGQGGTQAQQPQHGPKCQEVTLQDNNNNDVKIYFCGECSEANVAADCRNKYEASSSDSRSAELGCDAGTCVQKCLENGENLSEEDRSAVCTAKKPKIECENNRCVSNGIDFFPIFWE